MSEHVGEKTEQATPKRLEEAFQRGQFARSAEVQTVFVLLGALLALLFTGEGLWRNLAFSFSAVLGHLHDFPLNHDTLRGYLLRGAFIFAACIWPVLTGALLGSLLAGGLQSRFRTSPEALRVDWTRLDPIQGLQRIFSFRSILPTFLAMIKLAAIVALSFSLIKEIASDPIFYSAVDVSRISQFLASASFKIFLRVGIALALIAVVDYTYQFWQTHHDLMMTREELKEEMKNAEGNPTVKAQQRRKRSGATQRKMLLEVPKADVILTNPTHLAVALQYRRQTMKAPKILAKGARLNALKIREIALQYQIPVLENKPLARLLFRYGRVGGEIPAQLYAAVAEVLAWVYRVNAYRYHREQIS